jgi:hypothetical protein
MEQAVKVFMDYAAAFEKTYGDDDWSRLAPFFSENVVYTVHGGPMACEISGREAVLRGLKKSVDGFDRRCDERVLNLTDGPNLRSVPSGQEVSIDWVVSYRRGDSPGMDLPGRSVFTVSGGCIAAMRDEYSDEKLAPVGAWLQQYGADLDGSYV